MTIYTWLHNGSIADHKGYTSLKECCADANVSYNSAMKGKKMWLQSKGVVTLIELEVVRIKGRGRKSYAKQ